jgi:hypothetical protein
VWSAFCSCEHRKSSDDLATAIVPAGTSCPRYLREFIRAYTKSL